VVSDSPTIAQWRHPAMAERVRQMPDELAYQRVQNARQELADALHQAPSDVRARASHEVLTQDTAMWSSIRGAAIHELLFDHSMEEVAALLGVSRQRIQEVNVTWQARNGEQPWPKYGRWSRIAARRQAVRDADLENSLNSQPLDHEIVES